MGELLVVVVISGGLVGLPTTVTEAGSHPWVASLNGMA
jgi:hypothetical protein